MAIKNINKALISGFGRFSHVFCGGEVGTKEVKI